jgi:hypothetical protein
LRRLKIPGEGGSHGLEARATRVVAPYPLPRTHSPNPLHEAGAQASSLCRNRQDACSPDQREVGRELEWETGSLPSPGPPLKLPLFMT